jgi:hypothetical protein
MRCRRKLAQHFHEVDARLATARHLTAAPRLGHLLLLLLGLHRLGKLPQNIGKAAGGRCAALTFLLAVCCPGDDGVEQRLWIKHGNSPFASGGNGWFRREMSVSIGLTKIVL